MTVPCRRKHIEASEDDGSVAGDTLAPVSASMACVWHHIEELGITEDAVADAVAWSRGQ